MNPRSWPHFVSAALILVAGSAATMDAQGPPMQVGDFSVHRMRDSTFQDRSFASVRPEGKAFSSKVDVGSLVLACGRDRAGLSGGFALPAMDLADDTLPVEVRIGRHAPERRVLERLHASNSWSLRDRDVVPLFQHALRADTLSLLVPAGSGAEGPVQLEYALAELDSVLTLLECAVAPPASGRSAGRSTLEWVAMNLVPSSALGLPRTLNLPDVQRFMDENYPAELRDSGVTARVLVTVHVLDDGAVDSASVRVIDSTNPLFDDVAARAVLKLRFSPGTAYGRPTDMWMDYPLVFNPPPKTTGN